MRCLYCFKPVVHFRSSFCRPLAVLADYRGSRVSGAGEIQPDWILGPGSRLTRLHVTFLTGTRTHTPRRPVVPVFRHSLAFRAKTSKQIQFVTVSVNSINRERLAQRCQRSR